MEAKNAVRIQISVAIITYCLVAIVHHDMQLKRSTYEVLQILSISLTDKTHLRDLFDKTIFNDVKELDYPLFKGLNSTTIDMIGKVNPATEAKRDGNS